MPVLDLGGDAGLFYEYKAPKATGISFVFINALTGSAAMWEGEIAPALRKEGCGTLSYNLRGQEASPAGRMDRLDETLILDDFKQLMAEVAPPRPIIVGLSIGGLYGAKAVLDGVGAEGLVLINTLRKAGPRLHWMNEALMRAMSLGGAQAVKDFFLPMLVSPDTLEKMRPDCLTDAPYSSPAPSDGLYRLMREARTTKWDMAYEKLDLPVLAMTGLKDRIFLDIVDVKDLLARMPDARHVEVPLAGHLIPAEQPSRTINELLKFAENLD